MQHRIHLLGTTILFRWLSSLLNDEIHSLCIFKDENDIHHLLRIFSPAFSVLPFLDSSKLCWAHVSLPFIFLCLI